MEEFKNAILENNNKKSLNNYKRVSNLLLIISIIAYILTSVLLVYSLIDAISQGGWAWIGFVLILAVGTIGVAISVIFALIGLIMTARMLKQGVKRSRLILFSIFTALPIVSECAVILIVSLL